MAHQHNQMVAPLPNFLAAVNHSLCKVTRDVWMKEYSKIITYIQTQSQISSVTSLCWLNFMFTPAIVIKPLASKYILLSSGW